ncbi:MAG TPA: hypothetical protein VFW98_18810 [Gemmatimonadaceae bacterium]|nr:hypothetical protein [Gemmatimonadaceae bacterium]
MPKGMVIAMVLVAIASPPVAAQTSAQRHQPGPYDIPLFNTPKAPAAKGKARLVSAQSPFGIAVTADGHAMYDAHVTVSGLPAPATLGKYATYVAWGVTPDLTQWKRLGIVHNGTSTVGSVDFNKFLLVITAEANTDSASHDGPTVLHGTSPSGWLQTFLAHPLFRGVY